ncbi:MAG: hypothetical protein ABIA93_03760 [Candidatus Woesearchaeota archaeon]
MIQKAFTKELSLVGLVILVWLPFAIRDLVVGNPGSGVTMFILIVVIAFFLFSLAMNLMRRAK